MCGSRERQRERAILAQVLYSAPAWEGGGRPRFPVAGGGVRPRVQPFGTLGPLEWMGL